jgi:uncharacterized protein (TIGR03435 family)
MKRIAITLLVLATLAGCQLSTTPGVSAYPAFGGSWGYAGERLTGHTLDDLAERSVLLADRAAGQDSDLFEGYLISYLDDGNRYDVELSGDLDTWGQQLADLLRDTFGVHAGRETREIDVLVLTRIPDVPLTMMPGDAEAESHVETWPKWICRHGLGAMFPQEPEPTRLGFTASSMADLALALSYEADVVVVDETGLSGVYDFEIRADSLQDDTFATGLKLLGLQPTPARRKVSAAFIEPTGQKAPHPAKTSDTYTILR